MSWEEKFTSFGRAAFTYSAVQPYFNINFPWSLGYIRKLLFGTLWGTYFTLILSAANIRVLWISNLQRRCPIRVKMHTFVESSLGYSHALKNSRQACVGFRLYTSRSAVERATAKPTRPNIWCAYIVPKPFNSSQHYNRNFRNIRVFIVAAKSTAFTYMMI